MPDFFRRASGRSDWMEEVRRRFQLRPPSEPLTARAALRTAGWRSRATRRPCRSARPGRRGSRPSRRDRPRRWDRRAGATPARAGPRERRPSPPAVRRASNVSTPSGRNPSGAVASVRTLMASSSPATSRIVETATCAPSSTLRRPLHGVTREPVSPPPDARAGPTEMSPNSGTSTTARLSAIVPAATGSHATSARAGRYSGRRSGSA